MSLREGHNRARPNRQVELQLVLTGQRYIYETSRPFLDQLDMLGRNYHSDVGPKTHGQQNGRMLERPHGSLLKTKIDHVFVYGETDSTMVGVLMAAKLHILFEHIAARLRTRNAA